MKEIKSVWIYIFQNLFHQNWVNFQIHYKRQRCAHYSVCIIKEDEGNQPILKINRQNFLYLAIYIYVYVCVFVPKFYEVIRFSNVMMFAFNSQEMEIIPKHLPDNNVNYRKQHLIRPFTVLYICYKFILISFYLCC